MSIKSSPSFESRYGVVHIHHRYPCLRPLVSKVDLMCLGMCLCIFRVGNYGLTTVTRIGERRRTSRLARRSFGHIYSFPNSSCKADSSALLECGFCIITQKGDFSRAVGLCVDRCWWRRAPGYEVEVVWIDDLDIQHFGISYVPNPRIVLIRLNVLGYQPSCPHSKPNCAVIGDNGEVNSCIQVVVEREVYQQKWVARLAGAVNFLQGVKNSSANRLTHHFQEPFLGLTRFAFQLECLFWSECPLSTK